MDKSIGFKTVWGIWYSFPNLQHYWIYIYMNHQICCLHPEISQHGKSERSHQEEPFKLIESTLWFPPSCQTIIFHQTGFSWDKRISLPKLYILGALPTRVFLCELIWPFTPIQRNRFRHHHRFSSWCFRPHQTNMIVKMGSSSQIFEVKIKKIRHCQPDNMEYPPGINISHLGFTLGKGKSSSKCHFLGIC